MMTSAETTTTADGTAISRIIRHAAGLISQAGYAPVPTGEEPGYSADDALCTASGCGRVAGGWGHVPACDAVHARVAGYLFLTGKVTGHRPGYLPGVVEQWETYEPGEGHRSAADVLAVLTHAASILGSDTSQPPANGAVSSPAALDRRR